MTQPVNTRPEYVSHGLLREYALRYVALGFVLIPLAPGTSNKPTIKWKNKPEDLVRTPADVDKWWPIPGNARPGPRYNIGLACGPSKIIAIDYDTKSDVWGESGGTFQGTGPQLVAITVGIETVKPWPLTWSQYTKSNGTHVLYKWDYEADPIGNSVSALAPGVDIRADGGLLVMPPSQGYAKDKETGQVISVGKRGHAIVGDYRLYAPEMTIATPAPSLADAIRETKPTKLIRSTLASVVDTHRPAASGDPDVAASAGRFLKIAIDKAATGQGRNNSGLWLATQLRDLGVDLADAETVMKEYAAKVGQPHGDPYTEKTAIDVLGRMYATDARPYPAGLAPTAPAAKIGPLPRITGAPLRADVDQADETPDPDITGPQKGAEGARVNNCPPLPAYAAITDQDAAGGCPWLDDYITYSAHWSTRAWPSFHAAVGVWILSTVAARRVMVIAGAGEKQHTGLYILLTAPSSTYAKTTTARIGFDTILAAGLEHLLLPDDLTPQALIARLSRTTDQTSVNSTFKNVGGLRQSVAFAGQRGWVYEEFGSKLTAMMNESSAHAEYKRLLRALFDTLPKFETETLARGAEMVTAPYIALLGNLTPADMTRYAGRNNALWSDGFWPRFLFACPHRHAEPNYTDGTEGERETPTKITAPLRAWHDRLGTPKTTEEYTTVKGTKGGADREFVVITKEPDQHPETVLHMTDDAADLHRNYDRALNKLGYNLPDDLRAIYTRHATKTLRLAAMFASMSGQGRPRVGDQAGAEGAIERHHYGKAMQVMELFRNDLHNVYDATTETVVETRARSVEDRVRKVIESNIKGVTSREIYRRLHIDSKELTTILRNLVDQGIAQVTTDGKTTVYTVND